jgi:hypothetical protein
MFIKEFENKISARTSPPTVAQEIQQSLRLGAGRRFLGDGAGAAFNASAKAAAHLR